MQSRTRTRLIGVAVAVIAAAIFWRTAYPTITWWDSSNYSLAAITLGITSPPGSLLLTLLGWVVTRLPLGVSDAHALNLFAGVLGALASWLIYIVALRMVRVASGQVDASWAAALGAGAGALTFAFSATLWEYSVMFTPYVLTAVFTGLILLTMLTWWEAADDPGAWRWLLLLAFLFGLDFSVHRTNALLIPGALVWIMIRRPAVFRARRSWCCAAGGLLAGMSLQLALIPITRTTNSPINMFDPSSLSRLWDYISLEGNGGNFLINVFPRKSPFWGHQVADLLRVLRDNFFVLPLVAAVGGAVAIAWWNRRLLIAFALAVLLQAAATVIYFNIPADYFRSLDRHYLPVCAGIAVLAACGLAIGADRLASLAKVHGRVIAVATPLVALVPAAQLAGNFALQDGSDRWFTRDFAVNVLESLPPNAIFYTAGDNDTFPVLYMQFAEGVRKDVTLVNMGMTNVSWYVDGLMRAEPSFPLSFKEGERERRLANAWRDTLRIDSIVVRPKPSYGAVPMPSDFVFLDLVQTNRWRRPLTFAVTLGSNAAAWLAPYAQLEGLYWRIVPEQGAPADTGRLRANLLDRYEFRGFADSSTVIDATTRTIGFQYYSVLSELLTAERNARGADACRDTYSRFMAKLPAARLSLPEEFMSGLEAKCS